MERDAEVVALHRERRPAETIYKADNGRESRKVTSY
jgi:hypothetical protein